MICDCERERERRCERRDDNNITTFFFTRGSVVGLFAFFWETEGVEQFEILDSFVLFYPFVLVLGFWR